MNVIIIFENGEKMEIEGCSGFEVQAGGDICTVRKNDGTKMILNFRKMLFICERSAFEGAELSYVSAAERKQREKNNRGRLVN